MVGLFFCLVLTYFIFRKPKNKRNRSIRHRNRDWDLSPNEKAISTLSRSKLEIKWHGANETVEIQGYKLKGLVYTGASKSNTNIPNHVILRNLKVQETKNGFADKLEYWPAYSDISPACRAKYLRYLANGATDPNIEIGYVFLYFYGLETRLMQDSSQDQDEVTAEVRRLRNLYANSNESFNRYSKSLLECSFINNNSNSLSFNIYKTIEPDLKSSMVINLCISELANQGETIPSELIADGIMTSFYCNRTPFIRAKEKFNQYLITRLDQKYPTGFKPRSVKRKYRPEYFSASGNFKASIYRELPLVVDDSFYNQFKKLVDECCDQLDEYSRFIGKTHDVSSLYSKILLPKEIYTEDLAVQNYITKFTKKFDDEETVVLSQEQFLKEFGLHDEVSKKEYVNIINFFKQQNFGILPNTNLGDQHPKQDESIILFQFNLKKQHAITEEYFIAKNIVDLAVAVANVDFMHPKEIDIIKDLIVRNSNLNETEKIILKNRISFLERNPRYLKNIKSRIKEINNEHKYSIVNLLVSVVAADNKITSQEQRLLKSISEALGFNPDLIISDLSALTHSIDEDISVIRDAENEIVFKIPSKPQRLNSGLSLDMELVDRKRLETLKVNQILTDIFKEDDPIVVPEVVDEMGEQLKIFFNELVKQSEWTRESLEAKARENKLFLGSAIEKINDWSLENFEEIIIFDDGKNLTVNKELLQ